MSVTQLFCNFAQYRRALCKIEKKKDWTNENYTMGTQGFARVELNMIFAGITHVASYGSSY